MQQDEGNSGTDASDGIADNRKCKPAAMRFAAGLHFVLDVGYSP
jgi:hypothetical protein